MNRVTVSDEASFRFTSPELALANSDNPVPLALCTDKAVPLVPISPETEVSERVPLETVTVPLPDIVPLEVSVPPLPVKFKIPFMVAVPEKASEVALTFSVTPLGRFKVEKFPPILFEATVKLPADANPVPGLVVDDGWLRVIV